MNILVVSQYYWPEPFNTSDFCESLIDKGHKVTVLTGFPTYGMPDNKIPKSFSSATNAIHNGVKVVRVKQHPVLHGLHHKLLNYLSFCIKATLEVLRFQDDYDVVIGYQFSPIISVIPALVFSKLKNKPFLLYCFDLWPASLSSIGLKKDSFIYRIVLKLSRFIYSSADTICVTSPSFIYYLQDLLQVKCSSYHVLPQYAEECFSNPGECRLLFSHDKCNITFAGNIGKYQSVETIVKAANVLRNNKDICFHIVGSGSELSKCKKMAVDYGLENIVFHGRKPLSEMKDYYASSDAMLITSIHDEFLNYTLPRKVQSYLAFGVPVIAATEGESACVIKDAGCGFVSPAEDFINLAANCKAFSLINNADYLTSAAKAYYKKNFSRDLFYKKLDLILEDLCN